MSTICIGGINIALVERQVINGVIGILSRSTKS